MRKARSIATAMSLALLFGAVTARAENEDDATRSAARMLGYSGIEAYQAGGYRLASERLEKSFQLLRVPSLGLWSARALVKLGKLIEAHERYATVAELSDSIGDAPVQRAAKREAQQEGADLWPRIPRLTIEVAGANSDDVSVTLDGVALSRNRLALPLPLNPGQHRLVGSFEGQRAELALVLLERMHERAVLRFKPSARGQSAVVTFFPDPSAASTAPQPAASAWPIAGWITLGVGAAALTTGVVTYVLGRSEYDDLPPGCRDGSDCSDGDADGYDTLRSIHIASTVAGGVLAVVGVSILLVARDAAERSVVLSLGPASASLVGRF